MITLTILEIIAIIIIVILLIIAIVLYLGIRVKGNWEKIGSELELNLDILLFSKFNIFNISYPEKEEQEEEKSENEKEDGGFDIKKYLDDIKPSVDPLLRFFKSFLNSIEVKKLQNYLDFGLDSYVDTAKYVGYMWSILVFPNSMFKNAKLSVNPCFNESKIDFKGNVDIKINLLKLVIPAIRLIADKNIRNLIKKIRSSDNA